MALLYLLPRMYTVRDASRDKPFELEMGWLCEETDWKYTAVPTELV
jgi:20S proteasome subunit alpha 7